MRKIVSATLAGFVVGIFQSLYFMVEPVSLMDVIVSPLILFAVVAGFGSGLAATEADNAGVNLMAGVIIGIVVYSFLGYYTGFYVVSIVLGIITGAVTAFAAHAI